jgi:hypothetical protein
MSTLYKFVEKGKVKKTISTAIKAYDNGISIHLIANISSIAKEEVIRTLKKNGKMVGT